MYLNRIRISNWRAIRDAIDLALDTGVNVIHGPNETGKSTVLDAICRGFFDRHTTGMLKDRVPWGTQLGPRVEIEFTVKDQRYRLTKRFIDGESSELRQLSGGTWAALAEGATADDRLLRLVQGKSAGRGLTASKHWGIAQVLWCEQGEATRVAVDDDQKSRLQQTLNLAIDNPAGREVEHAIKSLYASVFTDTGQYRRGQGRAKVSELEEQVLAARQSLAAIEQRVANLEQLHFDLAATERDRDAAQGEYQQVRDDLATAEQKLQQLAEQRRVYEQLERDAQDRGREWTQLNDRVNAIRKADALVAELSALQQDQARQRDAVQLRLATAAAALVAARAARAEAIASRDRAQSAVATQERRVTWQQLSQQLAELASRRQAAETLARDVASQQEALDALQAPSAAELKTLRKLHGQLVKAQARLDAASLRVRIEPARPIDATLTLDDQPRAPETMDTPRDEHAVGSFAIDVPGVVRISVRAGESDAPSLQQDLDELRRQWREQVSAFASADLVELESLGSRRAQAETRLEQLLAQQKASPALASLPTQQAALDRRRRNLLSEDATLAQQPEAADDETLERSLASAREALAEATRRVEDADAAIELADGTHATLAGELTAAETAVAVTRGRLDDQRAHAQAQRQADGLDDAARAARLAQALAAMDAAQQRLDATARPPVDDLADEIERLQASRDRLDEDTRALDRRIAAWQVQVEREGGVGLHALRVSAMEELGRLLGQYERALLDADAIKLLRDLLVERKKQVFTQVQEPIRAMVQTQLVELVGPRITRVDFDGDLTPSGIVPNAAGNGEELVASVEQLSFGTREQLMLLVRLSLARLLSRAEGRQCVVLDDPLVNADRGRQLRALRLIEKAADDTQVLIFTCHATAYAGLARAKQIDLAAVIQQSREAAT
jgi:DNA repair exonuclease SbcCD ATPase subunit